MAGNGKGKGNTTSVGYTHTELVKMAARWLSNQGCQAVCTELQADSEIPDAIGWKFGRHSILVECKTSKSDFYADQDKAFRLHPELGMGYRRFYLAPKGLLTIADVAPKGWGLLEAMSDKVFIKAPSSPFLKHSTRAEMKLLVSALRRVQFRIEPPLYEIMAWQHYDVRYPVLSVPCEEQDACYF